jgi:hypothetical protein
MSLLRTLDLLVTGYQHAIVRFLFMQDIDISRAHDTRGEAKAVVRDARAVEDVQTR